MNRLRSASRFALVSLAIVCLLQTIRALFPLALFQSGLWNQTITQAGIAAHIFSLFCAAFFAPVLARLLGWRAALLFAGGGLALARLAMQFAPNESTLLLLASAAIASAWLLLPLALRSFDATDALPFPLAVMAGVILDSALNAAFFTWDYVWQPSLVSNGVALLIATVMLVALHVVRRTLPAEPSFQWDGYLMLAPFLALHTTFLTNSAFAAALTGLSVPAASALILLASAAAIIKSLLTLQLRLPLPVRILSGIAVAAPLFFIRTATGVPGILLILLGHIAAGALFVRPFASPMRTTSSFAGTILASGATSLLFAAFAIIINYAGSIIQLPTGITVMPAAAILLMALLAPLKHPRQRHARYGDWHCCPSCCWSSQLRLSSRSPLSCRRAQA